MFINNLFVTFSIAVSVENFSLKPNWSEASIALFSKYSYSCTDINFSKILTTVERTEIGRNRFTKWAVIPNDIPLSVTLYTGWSGCRFAVGEMERNIIVAFFKCVFVKRFTGIE